MNEEKIKGLFFSMYWGQEVFCSKLVKEQVLLSPLYCASNGYLLLRSISDLTDGEIVQIAQFAHQMPNSNFIVKRDVDIIHAENTNSNGITHHISLRNNYGTVNANVHFSETAEEKFTTYKANIGETPMSARYPVPYIAITDYLRSIGILLPFTVLIDGKPITYSIDEILAKGWCKLKNN